MITFALPDGLSATEPPPERDGVRLLVAGDGIEHAVFRDLPRFLRPGDLVVVNNSATLAAAVDGHRRDGAPVVVHFSAELEDGRWAVEVRPPGAATGPVPDLRAGEVVVLPRGVEVRMDERYPTPDAPRLWRASVALEAPVPAYLARVGRPITYSYVTRRWPIEEYQTVFAVRPGSAEMPSAGRPFTVDLVTALVSRGVAVAPITLHAGVSSPEAGEPPLPERFAVPASTARLVNATRWDGGRVVAVGTTVARALESAADGHGFMRPRSGWTNLVLGGERPACVVDGLITGWHAPGASHLDLLEAIAGRDRVAAAYDAAVAARYRWHEFGDSALLWREGRQ